MEVTDFSAETFWKGETEIRGTVTDEGERYRVRILRKGSQIFDYSCSHVDKDGKKLGQCLVKCQKVSGEEELCGHGRAVLSAWRGKEEKTLMRPVSTSQKIRFMVREYTNREVSRIMGAGEEGQIRLVPRLFLSRDQIRVRFFVGREKLYEVKELVAFSQAVEFGRLMEYGKGLSFHHSLTAFEEADRSLALFLLEMIGAYREYYAQLRKGPWESEPVLKELILGKSARERFFSLMEGRMVECEDFRKEKRVLSVKRENPGFQILVEPAGKDGVRVLVPEELMAFWGEKSLFVADREAVYCCDEEYTQALGVLMEYMVMGQDAQRECQINDRDMPLFL